MLFDTDRQLKSQHEADSPAPEIVAEQGNVRELIEVGQKMAQSAMSCQWIGAWRCSTAWETARTSV